MTDRSSLVWKLLFGIAGAAATGGALILLFIAAFPYLYAESGSARYARDHRGEAILQVIGAAVLFWVAWQCIRRLARR